MGWKAKTRRDDEGKRDGQKKRVGRGERRRRQAGKGAGRLRLFVLAMVVVVGFARQLYRDRLRILPRAELDENHAIRDDRHETRRDQRFHEQRGTQKQRAQPMMPGKEFAGFSHEAPFKWIGVPCRECCFPYSRTVALRWSVSLHTILTCDTDPIYLPLSRHRERHPQRGAQVAIKADDR